MHRLDLVSGSLVRLLESLWVELLLLSNCRSLPWDYLKITGLLVLALHCFCLFTRASALPLREGFLHELARCRWLCNRHEACHLAKVVDERANCGCVLGPCHGQFALTRAVLRSFLRFRDVKLVLVA